MRILLVDDEPQLLETLEDYFEDRGYSVVTADNGKVAWELIQHSSTFRKKLIKAHSSSQTKQGLMVAFDMILTDQRMPVLDGVELVKKLREQGFTLPIVMISGDLQVNKDDDIMKDLEAFISKPAKISLLDEVFSKIESNLKKQPNIPIK